MTGFEAMFGIFVVVGSILGFCLWLIAGLVKDMRAEGLLKK